MKVGLGTAQFGMDYGISNSDGQVSPDEAGRILARAALAGVSVLDTAAAYDDAEIRLGELLRTPHPFSIVTKLPPSIAAIEPSRAAVSVAEAIGRSLLRMRQDRVYAVLVHGAEALLGPSGTEIWAALERARDVGAVARIGASIYTADELDALIARFPVEVVQVPVNVLDQRLVRTGHLARLRAAGIEVHARSVFLQGVLLMDPDSLPTPQFAGVGALLRAFRSAAHSAGASPLQAAVAYVLGLNELDTVVFGVTREAELAEILAAVTAASTYDLPSTWFEPYESHDERILNPASWPR